MDTRCSPKEGTPVLKKTPFLWLCLLLAVGLVAAACGSDDDTGSDATTTTSADGDSGSGACPEAEGDVIISGSSTVQPISARVGELLEDCGSGILATVDGPGTGDGFELFCAGETEISDASRPIDADEVASCEESSIEFIELKIGIDGIAVLTSPDNEIECLSFADLYALVGPESEGFDSWSDAQELATELGSTTTFPDASLDVTAPGEESGTYDSFIELVFGDIAEARVEEGAITEDEAETTRKDYSSQSDDNAILAGIEGSDAGLGWVGFAFAEQAGDEVTEIPISAEPGGECVAPTAETIADGTYPIARDLYIYVNAALAEENLALSSYVDFYLSDEGIASVAEVGYVELPLEELEATRSVWENRETGTRDGG
jgi:phosphate transport system substrate-binding protein